METSSARPHNLVLMAGTLLIALLLGIALFHFARPEKDAVSSATPGAERGEYREAMHYVRLPNNAVQCELCFRECVIAEGRVGFCRNRQNIGGTLYSLVYGRTSAIQVDPVEKEPLYHFMPGMRMLCIGTAGCNLRCSYCQNWHLSQRTLQEMAHVFELTPREIVDLALEHNLPIISFTYNEPTTCYEYLYDVARMAKKQGLKVVFHTNGTMKPKPLTELLEYVDAVTVDLKGFTEEFYATVSEAKLAPVLETLKIIRQKGVWLEIVNLVVPTLNDSPDDIRAMCTWIKDELGESVPLHFSRFFPTYRLTNLPPTPVDTLERAHKIAKEVGLLYVSIGNVPGHPLNSTYCPNCRTPVLRRIHFTVVEKNLEWGKCTSCGHEIHGIWN